jgi:hypothetical protein
MERCVSTLSAPQNVAPPSCSKGTEGLFLGVKRPGHEDNTHLRLLRTISNARSQTSLPTHRNKRHVSLPHALQFSGIVSTQSFASSPCLYLFTYKKHFLHNVVQPGPLNSLSRFSAFPEERRRKLFRNVRTDISI